MYTELETYMMEVVEKTLAQRAQRRKENALFYAALSAMVFAIAFACAYTL